jgi:hypothetical protein
MAFGHNMGEIPVLYDKNTALRRLQHFSDHCIALAIHFCSYFVQDYIGEAIREQEGTQL